MTDEAKEPTRDGAGRWRKGTTGNAGGRPRGVSWHQQVRNELRARAPEIIAALLDAAAKGDAAAGKLLLDKVLPNMRSGDLPLTLPDMQGGIGPQARSIMQGVAKGKLAVADAADLLGALANVGRIMETHELEARLVALEQAAQAKP